MKSEKQRTEVASEEEVKGKNKEKRRVDGMKDDKEKVKIRQTKGTENQEKLITTSTIKQLTVKEERRKRNNGKEMANER